MGLAWVSVTFYALGEIKMLSLRRSLVVMGVGMVLSTGASAAPGDVIFNKFDYSSEHWSSQYPRMEDPQFIARLKVRGFFFAFYINPTDSRGYRSIVRLVNKDMLTTYNRAYTFEEKAALQLALSVLVEAYETLGLITQVEVAGNNSQSFDAGKGETFVGKPSEPSMLHGHVIGRGNPEFEYITGIKLGGPIPGALFNMRGNDPNSEGNETKGKWSTENLKRAAHVIADKIKLILATERVISTLEIELDESK